MKIIYTPLDELVIHSLAEYSLRDMARLASQGCELGELGRELLWANGMVIDYSPLTSTDTADRELIENNRVHWRSLVWARMPEYKPILDFGEGVKIPILDVSSDPIFNGITRWIEEKQLDE